jgi:two-component system sensor histidine kinase KdpD
MAASKRCIRLSTLVSRPDPDRLLKQLEAEERLQRRGRLKIFLGYASGVGKSYRMLDEGRRRKDRGQDVVVGALQPHIPPEADCALRHLETIPVDVVEGVPVMNVREILRRRPQVCLVDGLAYDNPPGSAHAKRWQDVEQLLDAGISVITTVNLQYIEEPRDEVEQITGKRAAFTVPLSFVNTADEIVVVDTPAETCLEREQVAYSPNVMAHKEQQLSRLRELALVLAADVVDHQLESYLERHGIEQSWGAQERILAVVTPDSNVSSILASGRRNARRFHGELYIAYTAERQNKEELVRLNAVLDDARAGGAHVQALPEDGAIEFILQFAYAHGITQIFIGQGRTVSWRDRIYRGLVDRLIQSAEGIDIQVFPN